MGMPTEAAYKVAQAIRDTLSSQGGHVLALRSLETICAPVLGSLEAKRFTERVRRFSVLKELTQPLVVLIGGATGVGKSTLATQLAYRLGLNRITSTDLIRQVMRAFFTPELMPIIHSSCFEAVPAYSEAGTSVTESALEGFLRQTEKVEIGIKAVVERAINEQMNIIVEGAHVVAGRLQSELWSNACVVQIQLAVSDETLHKEHFLSRSRETGGIRASERYLTHFSQIRAVQEYLITQAKEHNVPILESAVLSEAINQALDITLEAVYARYQTCPVAVEVGPIAQPI